MNYQSPLSDYVLSCNGKPIKSLNFKPSANGAYIGVYARYGNCPTWTPLGIELPYLPTLQQVRDADRNIMLHSGSYENAHFYLRSADGNNVTTAFYTNADGGAIQSGDTDGYAALNLQPDGGALTYGGKEVATKNWVFGINNGDPDAAGFVRGGQSDNSLSTFNDLGTKSSFMGSIYANGNTPDGTTNTFWNVISVKHRNSLGDGVNYGLQLANIMSHGGSPNSGRMWFRNQFSGSWGDWYELATQNWVNAEGFLKTITGTSDRITVSGNTINIAANYAGQNTITTLGTIGTGTWNGSTIGIGYGGTGQTSVGTDGQILRSNGTSWVMTDALTFGGVIPASANLNTYQTTGIYIQGSNANAASGTNYPVALAGKLEVVFFNGGGSNQFIWQTYHQYQGSGDRSIYKREYYAGVWSSWTKMVDATNVPTLAVQNQSAAAQTGAFWINGNGRLAKLGVGTAPTAFLDVNIGTVSYAQPIFQITHNTGTISMQNGSSGTTAFNPTIRGTFAGTTPSWGVSLMGSGADSYATGAIVLRGSNTNYDGGITAGNLLNLQSHTTSMMTVDYLGNLKLPNAGSIIKFNSGIAKVINNVAEFVTTTPAVNGAIVIKHAVSSTNVMQDLKISIFSYALARLAEIRISFIVSTGPVISATGRKAYIVASSSMPTGFENINIGFDASGNLSIIIADVATVWSTYLRVSVERLMLTHSTYNTAEWESGWSISMVNDLSTYTGIVNVPTDILATQAWTNSAISSSGIFINNQNSTDQAANFRVSGNGKIGDYLVIGGVGSATVRFYNRGDITGGTTAYGTYNLHTVQADVTTVAYGQRINMGYAAGANPSSAYYLRLTEGTLGGSNTVTAQHGIYIDDLTVGASNYGITTIVSAGTNKWNIYAAGSAPVYLAGSLGIGVTLPTAFNAAATLFPSFVPKVEILTGTGTGVAYTEGLVLRHTGDGSTALNRNIGVVFKLSNEASSSNSNKAGAIMLGSTQTFANSPNMNFYIGNDSSPKMTIFNSGSIGIKSLAGTGTRMVVADSTGSLSTATIPTGTVTQVAMTVPTGLTVSGTPINTSGTLAVSLQSGYSIPTTASQTNWNTAFGWGNHAVAGYATSNLYTADGTLTSSRTVSLGGNQLSFTGGAFNITVGDEIYLQTTGDNISILANGVSLGNATHTAFIHTGLLTANTNLYLPGASGTLALTSDIVTLYNSNGTLTSNRTIDIGSHSLTVSGIGGFTVNTFDVVEITSAADSMYLSSPQGISLGNPIYQATFNTSGLGASVALNFPGNSGTLATQEWTVAQGYVNGNLATANLLQTADRTYDGDSNSLLFDNIYNFGVNAIGNSTLFCSGVLSLSTEGILNLYSQNGVGINAGTSFELSSPNISLTSSGGGPISLIGSAGVKVIGAGGSGISFNTNSTTSPRSVSFQDKSGTVALDEDFITGIYTPVITGSESYTSYSFIYTRVKTHVHVSGYVDVSVTGLGDHDFQLSLPVSTDITAATDLSGTVSGKIIPSGTGSANNYVEGNISSNTARVQFSTDVDAKVYVQFDYIIQ